MVESLFRMLKVNKMLAKEGSDFDKMLKDFSEKQKKDLKVPYKKLEKNFDIRTEDIAGTRCYIIKKKNSDPKVAVLYLFGGGYIMPPDPGDIVLCSQIADNSKAEVWFPMYPMAPDHKLVETLSSSILVYKHILDRYTSDNVRFFGTSSGGGQALSLCSYIKHKEKDIPMPGKLVLQSPGAQVPPSREQKKRMKELEKYDVMIPIGFFDNIAPVLAGKDDAYLLSPILDDMTGFPMTHVFYGTHEVMYAYLEDMQKAYDKYNVPLFVHVGENMMHCWGAMEFVPEAQAVRKEYFKALA